MQKPFLEAGEFVAVHGIAGELRLHPWCDTADFLTQFNTFYLDPEGKHPLEVVLARAHKNVCLVTLAGVDTVNAARQFIGKTVYIARKDAALPDGHYFVQDILGATVQNAATGEVYGRITAVTSPGKHDVYEIQNNSGNVFLFPAVEAFIEKRDIPGGIVLVKPIPGMFEPEEAPKSVQKNTSKRRQRTPAKKPEKQHDSH